jgi:hypothetical protein
VTCGIGSNVQPMMAALIFVQVSNTQPNARPIRVECQTTVENLAGAQSRC